MEVKRVNDGLSFILLRVSSGQLNAYNYKLFNTEVLVLVFSESEDNIHASMNGFIVHEVAL